MSGSVKAITYNGKTDTVENLARTLIVASVIQPPKGTFYLPLTTDGARNLGRALEWAMKIEARTEAERASTLALLERGREQMAAVKATREAVEPMLERAVQINRQSIWLLAASVLCMVVAFGFWVAA